jgi:hypothetical protein
MSDPRATAAVTGTAHKYAALQLHRPQQEDKKNTILPHLSYSHPLNLATKAAAQKNTRQEPFWSKAGAH